MWKIITRVILHILSKYLRQITLIQLEYYYLMNSHIFLHKIIIYQPNEGLLMLFTAEFVLIKGYNHYLFLDIHIHHFIFFYLIYYLYFNPINFVFVYIFIENFIINLDCLYYLYYFYHFLLSLLNLNCFYFCCLDHYYYFYYQNFILILKFFFLHLIIILILIFFILIFLYFLNKLQSSQHQALNNVQDNYTIRCLYNFAF